MNLVAALMRKHKLSYLQAVARAGVIAREAKARGVAKKAKLERAQLTLALDGEPAGEEPLNRFEPDDPTVNF